MGWDAQMRSSRLIQLTALTVVALTLAPASASARRIASRTVRPCRLHVEVPRAPIAAGESATIFGTLDCPKSVQPGGRQVTIYERSATSPRFVSLGTATSGASGTFQLTPPAL
jgi:hypothetical protein